MEYSLQKVRPVRPRIIIHGGAGNITRENLPPDARQKYSDALIGIVQKGHAALAVPHASALDVATYVVSLLEDNAMFNSGHGAVYARNGRHELEASIMTSKGYRKRGVGVMKITNAKNPIKVAREMLVKGELEDGGGASSHCQLEGETIERLAREWGLEVVKPSYFWTRKRWDEHRKALGLSHTDEEYEREKQQIDENQAPLVGNTIDESDIPHQKPLVSNDDPTWDGKEYLPQGTVGAVVLDSDGMLCVATSTGGLTNKLPGRIGDTPTLGSGFWAEQFTLPRLRTNDSRSQTAISQLTHMFSDCFPQLPVYTALPPSDESTEFEIGGSCVRGVAMSGTGNGDSFLRLNAVRTAAAIARFSGNATTSRSPRNDGVVSLQDAVTAVAGPHGMLQQSAEDRWGKTGEGEGGIIGIDFIGGRGKIVFDFNSGGMFHAWIDDDGKPRFAVFQDER